MTDEQLSQEAVEYIKSHRADVIARYAPATSCRPTGQPVSVFMAGSPGAGKTEVSKSFMRRFTPMPVRIDADEIRTMCPGYIGTNAHVFQPAANKGVNFLYDHALEKALNCILDGTFAYGDAANNIKRSVKRGRVVEVWFVYQRLEDAWEFTKAREESEARHVSKDVFIKSFIKARMNATSVKNQFGNAIKLNLLRKDYSTDTEDVDFNVSAADLDRATACGYSEVELNEILL